MTKLSGPRLGTRQNTSRPLIRFGSIPRSADLQQAVAEKERLRTDDAADIPGSIVHRGELAALSP